MLRALVLALLLAALLAAPAQAADVRVTNRLGVGLVLDLPHHGRAGGEILLSERFRARIRTERGLIEVVANGRTGLQMGTWTPNRTRIRELGVRIDLDRVHLEIGRHAVIGGGWRLVDGVQALARPWKAFEVGGWLGLLPDPWTTAPAPRFGGGPIVRWRGRGWQAAVVAEIAGTATGLDRLALRGSGRVEIGKVVDLAARAEIANGGPGVRAEELGVTAVIDPSPLVRVRAGWSMNGGRAYLQGVQRDPSLTRWWQRWTGAGPTDPVPWEQATDAATHGLHGRLTVAPQLFDGTLLRFGVNARAGIRPSDLPNSTARIAAEGGAQGLLGGRLDLVATGGALRWGRTWRGELGVTGWLGPDNGGRLQIEAGARVWLGRRPDGVVTPSVAADLYVDWAIVRGLGLAVGYRLDNDLDTDRWNTVHTALLRMTWRLDVKPGATSPRGRTP